MEEKLIEEVRGRPYLYDKSHRDYKKNEKRDKAWQEIGKELNITGEDAKKRWRTIKDRYMRLRRKQNLPSGSGSERATSINYKFGEMLSFLEKCNSVNKNTHCSYDEEAASRYFEEIIEEDHFDEMFIDGSIGGSTIVGEEERHQCESNEVNVGASYSEFRPSSSSSSVRARRQRRAIEQVQIIETNQELLNLMRTLKDDFQTTSAEAAFCDSLRVQLEQAHLPPEHFREFQVTVLQKLNEQVAKAKRDMPSTSQQF